MKRIISRSKLAFISGLCTVALLGVTAYALTTTPLAAGTVDFFAPFGGPANVRMSKTTMSVGETNGWHSHPGLVYVIVKSGTLTFESGCGDVHVYSAGQAFTEQATDIHRAVNYGPDPLEFYATLVVPAGSPSRINYGGPLCGPPADKNECKNGGWSKFNYPRSFVDQGDCVSFVETGR